jgi:hypothetical protein
MTVPKKKLINKRIGETAKGKKIMRAKSPAKIRALKRSEKLCVVGWNVNKRNSNRNHREKKK